MRTTVLLLGIVGYLSWIPRLSAQTPYGASSPLGNGNQPYITSNQAYLGNGAFEIRLRGGLPNGVAYLGLAVASAQTTFNGIPVNLDFSQTNSLNLLFLDNQGRASFPIPLTALTNTAFAGGSFYAQAYFVDGTAPNGVAASRGLRVTFTLPPLVYVGSNRGVPGPGFLVDPSGPAVTNTINGVNQRVQGSVFSRDGRSLFVAGDMALTPNITYADLSTGTPVWTNLHTFSSSLALSGIGLALDDDNGLLWSLQLQSLSMATLFGLDADPTSATFGSVVAGFPINNGGTPAYWAMNKTLRMAALGLLFTPGVVLVDVDPASGTFGQVLANLVVPVSPGAVLPGVTGICFSRDGDQMYVAIQNGGGQTGEVARYSFSQAAWIDHDPATTITDNLGPFSNPPLPFGPNPISLSAPEYGEDSDWFVVSGFGGPGGGWAGRVDLTNTGAGGWAFTPATGASLNEAWFSAVDPAGTSVAVAVLQSNGQGALEFFDPMTMAVTNIVNLPGSGGVSGSNLAPVAWR